MGIRQSVVNFDEMFYKLTSEPVIINDIANNTEDAREEIRQLVMSRFSSDMVSLIPSCLCGAKRGQFYSLKDSMCEKCGTRVTSAVEDDIEPVLWFRQPNEVERLINPVVWTMLRQRFNKSGFNIIQWLCDTSYHPAYKQPAVVGKMVEAGIQRGYNRFVQNFDTVINYLLSLREFKVKKGKEDYLKLFLETYKDAIFSDYLPLPNKCILIIEKTNVGVYVDPIIIGAIDAIEMLTSIDASFYDQNARVKANRTVKAIAKLSDFYEKFYRTNLAVKAGQFRKHIYGSRTVFSFRAVISSITGPHQYDEIYVPWGIGLTAFRPHLLNKLTRLGMEMNSAIGLLLGHVEKYHPLLDRLLQELITESRDGRLAVLLQRNPSLLQGSAQRVWISRFKTNPSDTTISLSILICKAYNADFDGDALNCSIALDNKMTDFWYPLAPEFNIFQLDEPDKISSNIDIPKPCVSAHSQWLAHD